MTAREIEIGDYDLDRELVEAARRERRARVAVYPYPGVAVVLGRGSDPAVELDLAAVRADGVAVLRRPGGGSAVVLDPGNVIVSVALPTVGFRENAACFDALTRWLIEGLCHLGIAGVHGGGISDLVLDDRKVAGSCIHRCPDSLYYSACLLVQPDIEGIARYLRHPPREPDYRRGRSHAEFLGSLGEFPVGQDSARFARALAGVLRAEAIELPPGARRAPGD
ncbi:MAG: hypothetical protein JXQ29_14140 [Planctomycetes bacterium]|nr:hypothetical protein [Planctomycetota bacterium]